MLEHQKYPFVAQIKRRSFKLEVGVSVAFLEILFELLVFDEFPVETSITYQFLMFSHLERLKWKRLKRRAIDDTATDSLQLCCSERLTSRHPTLSDSHGPSKLSDSIEHHALRNTSIDLPCATHLSYLAWTDLPRPPCPVRLTPADLP